MTTKKKKRPMESKKQTRVAKTNFYSTWTIRSRNSDNWRPRSRTSVRWRLGDVCSNHCKSTADTAADILTDFAGEDCGYDYAGSGRSSSDR